MQGPLFRLILIVGVAVLLLMAGVASARGRPAGHPSPAARPMLARPAAHAPAAPARQELTHPPAEGAAAAHPAPEANRAEGQEVPQQRSGRLTADERKALRRQIDEARDIYRPLLQHSH